MTTTGIHYIQTRLVLCSLFMIYGTKFHNLRTLSSSPKGVCIRVFTTWTRNICFCLSKNIAFCSLYLQIFFSNSDSSRRSLYGVDVITIAFCFFLFVFSDWLYFGRSLTSTKELTTTRVIAEDRERQEKCWPTIRKWKNFLRRQFGEQN